MYYLREALSFWVEIYERIGKFIILKIAKTKTRILEFLRFISSRFIH